jgi:DNA-binding transcriptional regulator GbsR (MarR family)
MDTPMSEAESAYVEKIANLLVMGGLPRIAGRMWAWLLICDPPQQGAADLASALQASRGSISAAARLLAGAGLVHRTTRAGDRREYFSVPEGAVISVLNSRMPVTVAWRQVADEGLELLRDLPPERRARIQEVRDVYAFMEHELPAMLERFMAQRRERTA